MQAPNRVIDMTSSFTRRDLLASCGTLAMAVAGCVGSSGPESGTADGSGPDPVPSDAWPSEAWRQEISPPERLLADRSAAVLYARTEAAIVAYAADGSRRWQRQVPGSLRTSTDGAVIVDGDGLQALERGSGETRWTVSLHEETEYHATAVHHGALYAVATRVPTASERFDEEYVRLYRINLSSGEETRLLDLPGTLDGDWVATGAGAGITLARDDGLVVAYDGDGTERWQTELRSDGGNLAVQFGDVTNETLFVGVRGDGESVHALATDTGEIRWEARDFGVVASATVERALLVGGNSTVGARVAAVDPDSGEEQWSRTIERGILDERYGVTTGGVHYGSLLLDDGSQSILALDAASGETVAESVVEGGVLLGPVLLDGRLVFATRGEEGGRLWATALVDANG